VRDDRLSGYSAAGPLPHLLTHIKTILENAAR
jgi:hypothetical protein